jgi:hypothetical protein
MKAEFTVIRLKYSAATSLAKTLDELFQGRGCRFVAEASSNTLLVQAGDNDLKSVTALIEKLDTPPAYTPK